MNLIEIGSGSEDLTALKKRAVMRRVKNPTIDKWTNDYDVGIVKVATPFVESAVQQIIPLVKAGEEPSAGEPAVVAGWGVNKISECSTETFVSTVQCRSTYKSVDLTANISHYLCFTVV